MTFTNCAKLIIFCLCICDGACSISMGNTFNLSGKNLTFIPKTIPLNVTHLILNQNKITTIKYGDLNRMIHLIHLDISQNRIEKINRLSFKGLKQLKVLNMSSNHLSDGYSLPNGVFLPLAASLQELDLGHNLIYQSYPDKIIKDLHSLETLKLDCIDGNTSRNNFFPLNKYIKIPKYTLHKMFQKKEQF